MIRYALNFSISIIFAESVQSVSCQIYDHTFIYSIILYILMYNNKYNNMFEHITMDIHRP